MKRGSIIEVQGTGSFSPWEKEALLSSLDDKTGCFSKEKQVLFSAMAEETKNAKKTFLDLDSGVDCFTNGTPRIIFFGEIINLQHLRAIESNENLKEMLE